MKRLLTIILMIPIIGLGQNQNIDSSCYCDKTRIIADSIKGFYVIEEKPIYPGGDESLLRFLKENLKFDNKVNGKIWIRFNVNCEGIACGFKSIEQEGNITKDLESEIFEIFKNLELFEPARQRGREVDCVYTIPIELINGT